MKINNFVCLLMDNGCNLWVDPKDVIAVVAIPENERLEIEEASDIHLVSGTVFKLGQSFADVKRLFNGWDGTEADTSDLLLVAEADRVAKDVRDSLVRSTAARKDDADTGESL